MTKSDARNAYGHFDVFFFGSDAATRLQRVAVRFPIRASTFLLIRHQISSFLSFVLRHSLPFLIVR